MDFPVNTVAQFGAHLRAFRKARGLTQAALGALLDVKQARIADIEADPGSVSLAQMHRILTLLGAQVILRGSPVPGEVHRAADSLQVVDGSHDLRAAEPAATYRAAPDAAGPQGGPRPPRAERVLPVTKPKRGSW